MQQNIYLRAGPMLQEEQLAVNGHPAAPRLPLLDIQHGKGAVTGLDPHLFLHLQQPLLQLGHRQHHPRDITQEDNDGFCQAGGSGGRGGGEVLGDAGL
jgi:hypothetical protein